MTEREVVRLTFATAVEARKQKPSGMLGDHVTLPPGTLVLGDERDSWRRYVRTFPKGVFVLASVLTPGAAEWQNIRLSAAGALAATEAIHEHP